MYKPTLAIESVIYQEMMSHPAIFSHQQPKKIAVICNQHYQIVTEVLKHPNVIEVWQVSKDMPSTPKQDPRLHHYYGEANDWANVVIPEFFDIIITEKKTAPELFKQFFKILNIDGILMQLSDSPFETHALKTLQNTIRPAGFRDSLTVSFPQPSFPNGWRTALMAKKNGIFRKIREKDIYNKTFSTRYYNYDVHKASLVMPEFMREELTI